MKTIRAVYENGAFRPQHPLPISEGAAVEIGFRVQGDASEKPWMRFHGCLLKEDTDEMMSAIDDAFEGVNPDEWR